MPSQSLKARNKYSSSFLFRHRSQKSFFRILLEAFLMLGIGANLFIFLGRQTSELLSISFLSQLKNDFGEIFVELFYLFSKVGNILIFLFLFLFSLVCIIGSFSRFTRVLSFILFNKRLKKVRRNIIK